MRPLIDYAGEVRRPRSAGLALEDNSNHKCSFFTAQFDAQFTIREIFLAGCNGPYFNLSTTFVVFFLQVVFKHQII